MMRPVVVVIMTGWLAACGALPVDAGTAMAAPAGSGAVSRSAAAPAGQRRAVRAPRPNARARQAAAKGDSTARSVAAPRRLEDIHIEGEIPAPQVLFVTARDQRRFTRFHHQRYLKTSVQVGEMTTLPSRIALTSHPPAAAGAR